MKQILIGLTILMVVNFMVNLIIQNFWLQVALVSTFVVLIVLTIFFAGVYAARDMMQRGADIVLRGQQINDQWDAAKMQALGMFGREIVKVKTESLQAGQQYPALPPFSAIEGSFTISGLDDEVKQ